MMKMIREKAKHEDVMKDFAIIDMKVNNNADSIGYSRKDIENLFIMYKKLAISCS